MLLSSDASGRLTGRQASLPILITVWSAIRPTPAPAYNPNGVALEYERSMYRHSALKVDDAGCKELACDCQDSYSSGLASNKPF